MLEDHQFSRAAQALSSSGLDFDSNEAYKAMEEKHPRDDAPILPEGDTPPPMKITKEQVKGALKSFRTGTAPGPSGLRAEHLKNAVFCGNDALSDKLLISLTMFVNNCASGNINPIVAPYFFGANLFAARKKHGGHRPIAVGEVLRHLTSKCLAFAVAPHASALLQPLQLGVGVENGCEAIIHAINNLFHDANINVNDKWVLQVDFKNAFNLVSRENFFKEVRVHFPELSAWVETCYGQPSLLRFGHGTIASCCGLHQGDPLTPLLFALALQPLLQKLQKEIPDLLANVWFLDDGILIGRRDLLIKALQTIESEGPPLGLHLSLAKSTFWCGPHTPENINAMLRNIPCSSEDGFELLGAPVGTPTYSLDLVEKRFTSIEDIVHDKLPLLQDS